MVRKLFAETRHADLLNLCISARREWDERHGDQIRLAGRGHLPAEEDALTRTFCYDFRLHQL